MNNLSKNQSNNNHYLIISGMNLIILVMVEMLHLKENIMICCIRIITGQKEETP